ncbi:hypothetical protein [Natrinema sp. DC36]|uniref:hypothetical protein n=1 Tax=Natrinema sp. DC36 TaxID=2878680 RepID=UPI001CF02893|nr:hypothetical protein [Natrinema sp. DC36]
MVVITGGGTTVSSSPPSDVRRPVGSTVGPHRIGTRAQNGPDATVTARRRSQPLGWSRW